jgi:uncharacterized damage-inducible protein DinB
MADSDETMLEKAVSQDGADSQSSTVSTVLKQITAHNSYHIGQIAMLRRQFGVWPPLRGGDSW